MIVVFFDIERMEGNKGEKGLTHTHDSVLRVKEDVETRR